MNGRVRCRRSVMAVSLTLPSRMSTIIVANGIMAVIRNTPKAEIRRVRSDASARGVIHNAPAKT